MLDHLDPFRRQSVALALYRMLTGSRFSISVVRECLDVAAIAPPRDRLDAVALHHCADYADLPPGFHAELASQTLALFAGRPVLGDGFLKDLAAAAGIDPTDAPTVQALVPTSARA
ncbi:MAG: hypothetical protein ABJF88_05620 [Rhodothermales bacterium]